MKTSKFFPKNKDKYIGNIKEITARSSWEFQFMHILDRDKRVIKWSSEELGILYRSPLDDKIHRYYPDFVVMLEDKDKNIKTYVIEIKPFKETQEPVINKHKKKKTILYEATTYKKNIAKWEAAKKYCKDKNYTFLIITEKNMRFIR